MAQDEITSVSAAGSASFASNSAFGWESRSSDELKEIVGRGLQGGELFEAARLELDRRASEARRNEEAVEQVEATHTVWRRRGVVVAIGVLVFAVPLIVLIASF